MLLLQLLPIFVELALGDFWMKVTSRQDYTMVTFVALAGATSS